MVVINRILAIIIQERMLLTVMLSKQRLVLKLRFIQFWKEMEMMQKPKCTMK